MDKLIDMWNEWVSLGNTNQNDLHDFLNAFHELQRIIIARSYMNKYPKYYRK